MHKNIYIVGIVGLSVAVIMTCFWITNTLIQGVEFNEFVAFPNLVIFDGVNILICEIIFLYYFHLKKYKVTFVMSLITTITFLILYTLVYAFYRYDMGSGDFINLVAMVHLAAVTLFGFSLIFSKASERTLLWWAGAVGVVVGLVILSTHIALINMSEGATTNMLVYINLGFSRLGEFIVVFYILNFYQEFRSQGSVMLQT